MRQLLKFGHSMTAIVFLGAIAVLWVLHQQLPDPERALSLYAEARQAMERIAVLLLLPSLVLSLLFGLFSMAMVTPVSSATARCGFSFSMNVPTAAFSSLPFRFFGPEPPQMIILQPSR